MTTDSAIIFPSGDDGALPVSRDRLDAVLHALELRLRDELVTAKEHASATAATVALAADHAATRRELLTAERVAEQIRQAIAETSERRLTVTQKYGAIVAGLVLVLATCGRFIADVFAALAGGR